MGQNEDVIALGVIGCVSCNRNPHITASGLKRQVDPSLIIFEIRKSFLGSTKSSYELWLRWPLRLMCRRTPAARISST